MRENVALVENMDQQRKEKKAENELKLRELQLSKLQEQIMYRDKLLENARAVFEQEQLSAEQLDDPRILELDEMISDPSYFPPIHSYGKATGSMIKNILGSNLNSGAANSKNNNA